MNISLAGKVAIVTGAFSGIGLAITHRFLECGAAGLVAVDRQPDIPDDLRILREKFDSKLVLIQGDVAEESAAQQFTQAAMNEFGRIDIMVSNAAISVVKAVHEHTSDEWDALMNVNVKAVYWAARHIIPIMIEQRAGLILITGSISGEAGIPMQGAYAASKGALHQMTRQLAVEYAKYNIRVNSIACGTVDTPLVHSSAKASGDEQGFWDMLRRNHPIGRVATAEEVAAFFAYMASDYATFFTGSVLMMDGGYTAQ
ncbi:MAG TPA: SDR family oxidoreductase [Bryobacteraceae bacterium]|jgi:NAD(P)-dependent dehydrogenase (short-subunit alcohol dehydrogenase family)|nr:SDR family oxidoreductase [Bryobacteraceae bacterium]